MPMTFAEWRRAGSRVSVAVGLEALNEDPMDWDDPNLIGFRLYPGLSYVAAMKSGWWTIAEREEESSPLLSDCERLVYFLHYVMEASGEWTLEALTVLLREFADWHGLRLQSADEMLWSLGKTRPVVDRLRRASIFLQWFIGEWSEAEERERPAPPPLRRFTFDVKLSARVTVEAQSEDAARDAIRERMGGAKCKGAMYTADGTPINFNAGADGEAGLVEIDGEAV